MTAVTETITAKVGFADYDHTRDLWNGRVAVPGLELECSALDSPGEVFKRFAGGEWDAAEMSFATYVEMIGKGDDSLVALPVFLARAFRHGAIWVGEDFPEDPAELAGKRIGITSWVQTSSIFVRGLLASRYGVKIEDIQWYQGGLNHPDSTRRPPKVEPFDIIPVPHLPLDQMLTSGGIDAIISSEPPASAGGRGAPVKRLFSKWTFEEMAYTEDTGIYPIMHLLVARRDFLEAHPGAADALVQAFTEAKDRAVSRAKQIGVPRYPLPWTASNMQRTTKFLGEDFWPYGLEANRTTLDVFLEYCAQQGVTPRQLSIEEVFAR